APEFDIFDDVLKFRRGRFSGRLHGFDGGRGWRTVGRRLVRLRNGLKRIRLGRLRLRRLGLGRGRTRPRRRVLRRLILREKGSGLILRDRRPRWRAGGLSWRDRKGSRGGHPLLSLRTRGAEQTQSQPLTQASKPG